MLCWKKQKDPITHETIHVATDNITNTQVAIIKNSHNKNSRNWQIIMKDRHSWYRSSLELAKEDCNYIFGNID